MTLRARTLGALLAAALGTGLAGRSARGDGPPAPPPAPKGGPAPPEPEAAAAALDGKIKVAIEQGVAFLRTQQRPDGSWGDLGSHVDKNYAGGSGIYQYPIGPTALAVYTLLKCGVPAGDPAVRRGFDWLRGAGLTSYSTSYEISAALLAVTAVADPFKKDKDSRAAGDRVRLTGTWRTWATSLQTALLERRMARGWRYSKEMISPGGLEDVSSTQFAVLALAAAERCGLPTDATVWNDAVAYVLTLQETSGPAVDRVVRPRTGGRPRGPNDDGSRSAPAKPDDSPTKDRARGFTYSVDPTTHERDRIVSGARTACGVGVLALARYALDAGGKPPGKKTVRDPVQVDQAIFDGLAWLATKWDPWSNPGYFAKHVFYLYCVERAMDLVGAERLGDHLWYLEMVKALLPKQEANGSWDTHDQQIGDRGAVCDTCFALLFLRRAAQGGVPIPIVTGDDAAPPVGKR